METYSQILKHTQSKNCPKDHHMYKEKISVWQYHKQVQATFCDARPSNPRGDAVPRPAPRTVVAMGQGSAP